MSNAVQKPLESLSIPMSPMLARTRACLSIGLSASLFGGLLLLSSSVQSNGPRFESPFEDSDFKRRIYAGASIGSSFLNPDTAGTEYRVDQNGGAAAQLRLGLDVSRRLAIELDGSVLGEAGLESTSEQVSYSVGSVSALIYGLNGINLRSRRQGWNAYGRLGFGVIRQASTFDALDESRAVPIFGVGIEYGFASGLGIRGEIVRVDNDAAYFGVGAVFRFGAPRRSTFGTVVDASDSRDDLEYNESEQSSGVGLAELSDPLFSDDAESADSLPALSSSRWVPEIRADDSDRDGVLDEDDRCPGTMSAVTVNNVGCGMFDSVLADVTFSPGSAWLSEKARARLDQLAAEMLIFPEARIKVRAHTDSRGAAEYNRELSARRAEAAVLYLRSVGIRKKQLEPFGIGEERPIASNASAAGRRENRRVEIITLANLSDEELLSEEPEEFLPREAWAKVIVPRYLPESGIAQPAPAATKLAKAATSPLPVPMNEGSESAQVNAMQVQTDAMSRPLNVRTVKRAAELPKPQGQPTNKQAMVDLDRLDAELSKASKPSAKPRPEVASRPVEHSAVEHVAEQLASVVPEASAKPLVASATAFQVPDRIKVLPWSKSSHDLGFVGIIDGLVFPEGSASLTSDARNSLTLLGFDLNANPDVRIAVMAHTDDQGESAELLALSQRRAIKIVKHLIDNGVAAERLEAEGYGDTLPLVQNVTEEDRAANRRVEVRVID